MSAPVLGGETGPLVKLQDWIRENTGLTQLQGGLVTPAFAGFPSVLVPWVFLILVAIAVMLFQLKGLIGALVAFFFMLPPSRPSSAGSGAGGGRGAAVGR